ncbi:kinase-like domain-containing protein [Lipomyces arxii]|uniref:kinase-like domain-containing protein n=1 Tax=Lipomyces arxii TaxID=56418 RepID=UPI0034CD666C
MEVTQLPKGVGFEVGHIVGKGAFASVHLCRAYNQGVQLFATKFINKRFAKKAGDLDRKDLMREIMLHNLCSQHKNIVSLFGSGEDESWVWIKMEAAMGGDLFDKIEPDVGVHEDICQLYFQQLISAVEFIHTKGVSHRDIKPENILMDEHGNLLLTDFGFAALYQYRGQRRTASKVCGSPPYAAPEVLVHAQYEPDLADIWSCGIVLFVLLCGCTPWDWAVNDDNDFIRYKLSDGHVDDYPWNKIPVSVRSLIRSMMRIEPHDRMSLLNVKRHPWLTRTNHLISPNGEIADPLELAERLVLNMRVDLTDTTTVSSDTRPMSERYMSSSQPVVGVNTIHAIPDRSFHRVHELQSQPIGLPNKYAATLSTSMSMRSLEVPEMQPLLQFSQHKLTQLPESLTQRATKFSEICPPSTMNKFYSASPFSLIFSHLSSALHSLGIPTGELGDKADIKSFWINVTAQDRRKCFLSGKIKCTDLDNGFYEVSFDKAKGDPLEWRFFFKKVAVLSKDIIYTEETY